MAYAVKLEQFEGPLDLLLDLIEKQELDITRVSIATVTDQYMQYVQTREGISLEHLAAFLGVAAKLLLIKSQALLPLLQLDDDDEEAIADLALQLEALRAIKDHVPLFTKIFGQRFCGARKSLWGLEVQFCPPEGINKEDLAQAFRRSLQAIPVLTPLEEKIVSDIVSLEQRIGDIQKMLAQRAEVAFSEMTATAEDPREVVVSFLALLELVKQEIIHVTQSSAVEDITITARTQEAA